MHSSLINKIRILKPRKRVLSSNSKNTSINSNEKRISIVQEKVKNKSPPPPLVSQDVEQNEIHNFGNDSSREWMPLYIVDVPEASTSKKVTNDYVDDDEDEPPNLELQDVTSKINYENSKVANITNRELNVSEAITCFLCHLEFDSVNEMQDHYLDKHKQKKKLPTGAPDNSTIISTTAALFNQSKKFKPIKPKGSNGKKDEYDSCMGEPKCPICSIYFKTENEVKEHMTTVHCYKCSECNNSFYTLYQFTDHKCPINKVSKAKKARSKKVAMKNKSPIQEKDPLSLSPIPKARTNNATPINNRKLVKDIETVKIISNKNLDPCIPVSKENFSSRLSNQNKSKDIQNELNGPQMQLRSESLQSQQNTSYFNASNATDKSSSNSIYHQPMSSLYYPVNQLQAKNLGSITNGSNASVKLAQSSPALTQAVTNLSGAYKQPTNSLLDYTFDQLTNKKFNKLKLHELTKNPSLSINIISPQKICDTNLEHYSCGRCNVLCESASDFVDHLHECLRLSNVSLLSTAGPPKKILKLHVKTHLSKLNAAQSTGINPKLLDQVGTHIDIPHFLINTSSSLSKDAEIEQETNVNYKSSFFVPCIKGNISINRVLKNSPNNASVYRSTLAQSRKTPMVMIPIDKSSSAKFSHQKPLNSFKDCASVSLPNRNQEENGANHVTCNIVNSEPMPIMSVTTSKPKDTVIDPIETFIKVDEDFDENSKDESGSVSFINKDVTRHPLVPKDEPDPFECFAKEKSTYELLLSEEEIKMEVEDEVVADIF